jgi:hypothetical protein
LLTAQQQLQHHHRHQHHHQHQHHHHQHQRVASYAAKAWIRLGELQATNDPTLAERTFTSALQYMQYKSTAHTTNDPTIEGGSIEGRTTYIALTHSLTHARTHSLTHSTILR